jgi:hypothetical protein
MSFELYLQSFFKGEFAGIPRERIREAFGTHLDETEANHWRVRYDDANSSDIYLTAASARNGFSSPQPVQRLVFAPLRCASRWPLRSRGS